MGPNGDGSYVGDAWVLGSGADSGGDHYIYQWQNSNWVQQSGAGTQIAISPEGIPWVINRLGEIFTGDGSAFELAPGGGCAISIGVGLLIRRPSWHAVGHWMQRWQVYQWRHLLSERLDVGATSALQTQIAVSPEGIPWVIQANGNIFYANGSSWQQVSGCATSIAVGPTGVAFAGPFGDAWVIGCGGSNIYQFQNGTSWVQIPGGASYISVSPDLGVPWVVNSSAHIFE